MAAPPPVVTVAVPLVIVSVVVNGSPSTSATLTPEIGKAVSSAVVCEPGTVFTGASFTGVTPMFTVAVSVTPPDVTV